MLSSVGSTSLYVAAARARETEHPQRLFTDPYARMLAGEEGFAFLSEIQALLPGLDAYDVNPGISIRTRFFDDALLWAVRELSLQQVVLVAAGMDTRAFRLSWPPNVEVFEIDRSEIFDYKEGILLSLDAKALCKRCIVTADLEKDWCTALTSSGFNPHKPTAFLLEGLLFFLKPSSVSSVLEELGRLACVESWLGMDLIGAEVLHSPYSQRFLAKLKQLGCPWLFGVSNPKKLLEHYEWQPNKIVVIGESEANYDRWPYPTASYTMSGAPGHYLVTARKSLTRRSERGFAKEFFV